MYYFPQDPPYFILLAGLFAGITCGLAFDSTLRQNVKAWSADRNNIILANSDGINLRLPFLGICVGIIFFLSAGLEIFGFPTWLAYSIALPLTILIAILLWFQLRVVFRQLDRGGSPALDLDSWEE
ncbi:hypothetical protein [Chamaesiphon sp.]|jgi:hypothetical protein|uniref:hypothetical protein n=1 Tax=Chamaesiphon sp. TaxID=2814140 RepID=UPI003592F23E